mmetsp:Transcript_150/g.484  ORF Transcript_150/g.484 Transcript_150/m.484 type:complete len:254 (+) Transcript_150:43-804(+)
MEPVDLSGLLVQDEVLPRIFAHLSSIDGPGALCTCRSVCELWRATAERESSGWEAACRACFPSMAAAVAAEAPSLGATPEVAAASRGTEDVDWFKLFFSRCAKRQEWATRRAGEKARKADRAARLEDDLANPGRVTKFAIGPDGRNNRSRAVREKVCKRCGERYIPGVGATCAFHPGRCEQLDESLTSVPGEPSTDSQVQATRGRGAGAGSAVVQRKAKSTSQLEVDASCRYRWSCCNSMEHSSPGCKMSAHY